MAKKKSFKLELDKALSTIKSPTMNKGFSKLNLYVSTGNYALNRRLSNRFSRGYRFGRSAILGGEPGSGKSLHAAYVCANAQREHGAHIVWVDIEKATDDGDGTWLRNLGLDLEELTYIRAGTVSDCKEILAKLTKIARETRNEQREAEMNGETPEPQQPIVIIFDSYSALLTDNLYAKAIEGDNTGDQGQLAKQIGDFIKSTTTLVDDLPVLLLGMVHIYHDQVSGGTKMTGGIKAQFMASYVLKLRKIKLTAEQLGAKGKAEEIKKVVGITSEFEVEKSRFSKPFEKVGIIIPYDSGMDIYSGLFEVAKQEGFVYAVTQGWWAYKDETGKEVKFQRPGFVRDGHADVFLKMAPTEPTRSQHEAEDEESTPFLEVEI